MFVLITGADGFIGRHLQQTLSERSIAHRLAVRSAERATAVRGVAVGDIGADTDWRAALDGVDVIVHLAARAHILKERARDPRAEFMRVNAEGTAALTAAAVAAGVRRIVYLSSVGVLGNRTTERPFSAHSTPRPHSAYAESKLAGEIAARAEAGARVELAIVRPPLVYGAFVRANFLRLMQWVASGRPLPLGAVRNARSLVSVWNLCDLIALLLTSPAAPEQPWLVSDGEDLSTPELIRRLGAALGRPARLLPVPVVALRGLALLAGRQGQLEQLCGSLTLDIGATVRHLQWRPSLSVDEGLARTARWYSSEHGARPC